MMQKVAILSFPRYFNYGTFLQMYALQQTVAGLGYSPELIDYDPYNDSGKQYGAVHRFVAALRGSYTAFRAWAWSAQADTFTVDSRRQKVRFQHFLANHLNLGDTTYFSAADLQSRPPHCDAVIVGSDQVWHPVGHHKDAAYFLSFTQQKKRIAYAPSFGVAEVPEDSQDWLKHHLAQIPHLSVREQAGAAIIKSLTGRDAQVVVDPAYLLKPGQWRDFAGEGRLFGSPYLLCYFLESDRYMRRAALEIAKARGLVSVMVPVHACDKQACDRDFKKLSAVGPREFVALVRDADYVCTDSFHGTSFSILFNRQFLSFKRYENQAQAANHSRLESILAATGLLHRVVDKHSWGEAMSPAIDFTWANARLKRMRTDSMIFLQQSLDCALENG